MKHRTKYQCTGCDATMEPSDPPSNPEQVEPLDCLCPTCQQRQRMMLDNFNTFVTTDY